ncbi:DUF1653 domain-containing protein [Roseococcus sp. SDR]|uniref:DUF1653 domain-containing protein n=1 Tax=Roseococcus sp. SDR TaxID=2835532 RepID=UPI001BD10280|nr:DUF1653 domain-containing protein [Roseococcus sp. SDR]MBS7790256.1 hypothetical protein [Roseococcus sp. SDR]MBV1845570.1 DUF1653 domain-containing protein [Roseococcus sp. SDR]
MSTDEQGVQPEYDRLATWGILNRCTVEGRPRDRAGLRIALCGVMREAHGASECEFCCRGECASLEAEAAADLVLAMGLRLDDAQERAVLGIRIDEPGEVQHAARIVCFAGSEAMRWAAVDTARGIADALCDSGNHAASAGAEAARKAISKLVLSELPVCWRPTHQHRKGGLYRVIARGSVEADLTPAVVYDDAEGTVWIRPAAEFDDGRFTAIAGIAR